MPFRFFEVKSSDFKGQKVIWGQILSLLNIAFNSTQPKYSKPEVASNKKIKKKKSFKQLILGKGDVQPLPKVEETKETEATSDDVKEIGKSDLVDSSSPDLNMANREKKKRKKRRQQRKPTDGQADDSSSLSSNQDEPVPVRPTQLANQKTEASSANQNTVGKVANQEQSPSPNVAIVEFKNEEINK